MSTSDVERVVVDVDELRGVDGLRARLGHEHRDRLADEADLVGGQHRAAHLLRRVDRRAGGAERLQVQVGGGVDADHTWRGRASVASMPVMVACANPDRTKTA